MKIENIIKENFPSAKKILRFFEKEKEKNEVYTVNELTDKFSILITRTNACKRLLKDLPEDCCLRIQTNGRITWVFGHEDNIKILRTRIFGG